MLGKIKMNKHKQPQPKKCAFDQKNECTSGPSFSVIFLTSAS
jgi:hypothetical protein